MIEQYLSFSLITILRQKFVKIFPYYIQCYYVLFHASKYRECMLLYLNYVLHWHLNLKFLEQFTANTFHIFADYNIATKKFFILFHAFTTYLHTLFMLVGNDYLHIIPCLLRFYLGTYIYIFYNCMTSLLLFKDAMAEPLHHVVTNASSLCCSFEHL